jgi:hypothetical protein
MCGTKASRETWITRFYGRRTRVPTVWGICPIAIRHQEWMMISGSARPRNGNRFHWNYLYFWDYSGGMVITWGVHMLDSVRHLLGLAGLLSLVIRKSECRLQERPRFCNWAHPVHELMDYSSGMR